MTHTHQPPASMESLKQPFAPSENATLGGTCRNCERLRAALAALVAEVERLRQQFQRETLRTSKLAGQLRRFVDMHEAEHAPGPWARGCALCECVGQAKSLLDRPLGESPLTDEQIMDLPAGVNDGTLSAMLRFARAIERAHGIGETP